VKHQCGAEVDRSLSFSRGRQPRRRAGGNAARSLRAWDRSRLARGYLGRCSQRGLPRVPATERRYRGRACRGLVWDPPLRRVSSQPHRRLPRLPRPPQLARAKLRVAQPPRTARADTSTRGGRVALHVIAAEVLSGRERRLSYGDAIAAVLASAAIPERAAPPATSSLAATSVVSTRRPTVAGLPRSGRDAAGRRRPPTAWPDAVAAWPGSPADTAAARRAAGTGPQVAPAAPPASPRP